MDYYNEYEPIEFPEEDATWQVWGEGDTTE